MLVNVGGKDYEISGLAYGRLPAWSLIKSGGVQLTGAAFDKLPEADKVELARHVQAYINSLSSPSPR